MHRRAVGRSILRSKLKVKHIVDSSTLAAGGSVANNSIILVNSVDNPVIANSNQIATGSKVFAIYIELHASEIAAQANVQVFDWYLIYDPNGAFNSAGSYPDPRNAGVNPAKQYIFKQGMEMVGGQNVSKRFGLIKIPKKYTRFNNQDLITLVWRTRSAFAGADNFCLKAIYKEVKA